MSRLELLRRLVRCVACGVSRWEQCPTGFACPCGRVLVEEDGVLRADLPPGDEVADCYESIGGLRFAEAEFSDNPQIWLATRAYRRHLGEFFPEPAGALADLGCGDGRFSLWALRHGFEAVVAVDRTLASLKRLSAAADALGLQGLLPLHASFDANNLAPGAFQAALAIESFTYLDGGYASGLATLHRLLADDGRAVIAEFCRSGRLLADIAALNLENMATVAERGRRLEKSGEHRLVQRLFSVDELVQECDLASLAVLERRGVSPLAMLFQHAWTFTSYPLRPRLDAEVRVLLETLDDQSSALCELSRNVVLLVRKKP